jgi:MFS family permease
MFAVLCSGIYWLLEQRSPRRHRPRATSTAERGVGLFHSLRFNPSYWYVVGVCLTFYSAIFPFRTFAIDFFTSRLLSVQGGAGAPESLHVLAHQQAGFYASLLPLSAMVATPLLGFLSDKIGRRATLMMAAAILLAPVYLIMGYTTLPLLVPLAMMGIAFAVIPAVMWPSVAYLVDQSRLGRAYALMTLIEQVGFLVMNLAIGSANDHQQAGPSHIEGYRLGLLIFTTLGFAGVMFASLLRRRERGPRGHGLENTSSFANHP